MVEEGDSKSGDGDMLSVSSSQDHLKASEQNLMLSITCRVVGMGNIRVKMFDGVIRTLCDVRHVLDLRKNLISLGTLDSNGFNYNFANGVMKVSKGILTVMKGQKLTGNIYKLMGTTMWNYNRRA